MTNNKGTAMKRFNHYIKTITTHPRQTAAAGLVVLVIVGGIVLLQPPTKAPVSIQPPQATAEIRITAAGFEPSTLSINVGTKVVWTNTEQGLHQVVSNPHPAHGDLPNLESALLNQNQTHEFTFDKPGTFRYHDEQNPTRNATIEVKEGN